MAFLQLLCKFVELDFDKYPRPSVHVVEGTVIYLEVGSSESRYSHNQKPASPSDKRGSGSQV